MFKKLFFCVLFIFSSTLFANTAHLPERKITVDHHTIYYTQVGIGPTILLVHGLFANKEQWQPLQILLAKKGYRVIVPDLPGYGKSLRFPFNDYQLPQEVKLLHAFAEKLHLRQFNIAGNSMGGAISALYAKHYPTEITSLALIGSPLGVISPKPSETNLLFEKGTNPFLPTTKKEVNVLLHLLFVHPPKLSDEQIHAMIEDNIQHHARKDKITSVMNPYRNLFATQITISSPVLIIWGNKDRIFDVSGVKVLHKELPGSKWVILKNAGHLPQVEDPNRVAEIYLKFLKVTD